MKVSKDQLISAWKQGLPLETLLSMSGCQNEHEFKAKIESFGYCYGCNK